MAQRSCRSSTSESDGTRDVSPFELKRVFKKCILIFLKPVFRPILGAAAGAGIAVFCPPAGVAMLGYGAGGITAGSYAAGMMSAAAVANGGGIAAGE